MSRCNSLELQATSLMTCAVMSVSDKSYIGALIGSRGHNDTDDMRKCVICHSTTELIHPVQQQPTNLSAQTASIMIPLKYKLNPEEHESLSFSATCKWFSDVLFYAKVVLWGRAGFFIQEHNCDSDHTNCIADFFLDIYPHGDPQATHEVVASRKIYGQWANAQESHPHHGVIKRGEETTLVVLVTHNQYIFFANGLKILQYGVATAPGPTFDVAFSAITAEFIELAGISCPV
ncbi:hypothetical protein ElyMa_003296300 [Elysia marginata]|uniref:Galectin n=1 Tax=Elysia marginata TaxID=1093978 RepID=A0AAV4JD38_9GAST|nr:hypothetical protein ElyMa_003296300 [Elysia marginata]